MEWSKSQVHSETIIHVDIDCFHAQVELLKRPHLQNEPVGVQQHDLLVSCNEAARRFGIKKHMPVSEVLKLCPQVLIFNGEDLYKYHQVSNQIHQLLLSFTNRVEKSGLDENYLDVTELVKDRENSISSQEMTGHCVGELNRYCACGCHQRLIIGSQIACEIRMKLLTELGFTSCCGISYNKVLAKVASSAYKPNQQTTLVPNGTIQFLQSLNEVEKIPGVGEKIKQLLESVNVRTVKDLQEVDLKNLKKIFKNKENAVNIKNLSLGICDSLVKQSGKVNLVELEDGFKKISVESDVKEKFRILLQRLMILVEEDGRMPMTVKVTIRKHNADRKTGNKETKQSPVPTCLFGRTPGKLTEESTNKLLNIIMGLFCKIVNISKPFHITLLGLGFSKFHEKVSCNSVASYLLKRRDLSVQSLTSFGSNESFMDVTSVIAPTCSGSESESDAEPSPKKTKLDVVIKKRDLDVEMFSPNKLNVENLNINEDLNLSKDQQIDMDHTVFRELPQDFQQDIIREWEMSYFKPSSKCSKQSLIHIYCMPNN